MSEVIAGLQHSSALTELRILPLRRQSRSMVRSAALRKCALIYEAILDGVEIGSVLRLITQIPAFAKQRTNQFRMFSVSPEANKTRSPSLRAVDIQPSAFHLTRLKIQAIL
jgi:hypothetical protein